MIEKFTVKSYEKMEGHPDKCMDQVEEAYFNTMDKCEEWCYEQFGLPGWIRIMMSIPFRE